MAASIGEAIGTFLISVVVLGIWFATSWRVPALRRRQDVTHYIAFMIGWGLVYLASNGAGGITFSHMLAAILIMTYVGIRAHRKLRTSSAS
jgi:hypothetical protein